jgi:hypothetical protein
MLLQTQHLHMFLTVSRKFKLIADHAYHNLCSFLRISTLFLVQFRYVSADLTDTWRFFVNIHGTIKVMMVMTH